MKPSTRRCPLRWRSSDATASSLLSPVQACVRGSSTSCGNSPWLSGMTAPRSSQTCWDSASRHGKSTHASVLSSWRQRKSVTRKCSPWNTAPTSSATHRASLTIASLMTQWTMYVSSVCRKMTVSGITISPSTQRRATATTTQPASPIGRTGIWSWISGMSLRRPSAS